MFILKTVLGYVSTYLLSLNLCFFQTLPFADTALICATSPIFTVFFARMFVKEPIFILDLVNVVFIMFGMVLIVKPSFLFGSNDQFAYDSNGIYALIAVVCGSMFLNSNVSVVLRLLKGLIILSFISNFTILDVGFLIF